MDHVALSYDERFLRRKVLTTAEGRAVLVDLSKTTSLDHGDALEMEDGSFVEVRAAQEELLEIRGGDLTRLAWHIGNRHTPCQINTDHLPFCSGKLCCEFGPGTRGTPQIKNLISLFY